MAIRTVERSVYVDADGVVLLCHPTGFVVEGVENLDRRNRRIRSRPVPTDDVVVVGCNPHRGRFVAAEAFDRRQYSIEFLSVAGSQLTYASSHVLRPVERVAVIAITGIVDRVPWSVVVADRDNDHVGAGNQVARRLVRLDRQ